jgi:leader peptidase (prepilin peptidase)/N-methyltransferase
MESFESFRGVPETFMDIIDLITHEVEISSAGRWMVAAWMFVFGAAIGSFMNVVVYRLPRRMSLSRPASRCPHCGHAIRWYDNVPIFGWLVLGGRCRDCHSAISARYPLVELCVALVCVALVFVIARTAEQVPGDTLYVFSAGRYALYVLPACTLICAALIEYDGQRVPPAMLLTTIAMAVSIAGVARGTLPTCAPELERFGDLARSMLGLAVGAWFAVLGWPAFVGGGRSPCVALGLSRAGELLLVGACLGACTVFVVAPAALILLLILRAISDRMRPVGPLDWSASVLVCTLAAMAATRWFVDETLYGKLQTTVVGCAAVMAIASLVAWMQARRRRHASEP